MSAFFSRKVRKNKNSFSLKVYALLYLTTLILKLPGELLSCNFHFVGHGETELLFMDTLFHLASILQHHDETG